MTEKRFAISSESNQNIWDNEKKCYYSSIDAKQLCDLLNELTEENERLQKERNHFEKKKTQYLTEWNTCRIQNTELKKENERLKTQLLKEDDVCDICKHQYLVASQKWNWVYIAKCEKGHEECGKGNVKHCEDFECKEVTE